MFTRRLSAFLITISALLLFLSLGIGPATAQQPRYYEQSRVMKFTPEYGASERYQMIWTFRGAVTRPFRDPKLYNASNYWMRAVFEDEVTGTRPGINQHQVNMHTYRLSNRGAVTGFGPGAAGERGGGGGGGVGGGGGGNIGPGGGGGSASANRNFSRGGGAVPAQGPGSPMQGDGGDGGGDNGGDGTSGDIPSIIEFSTVEIEDFRYTQDNDGYLLRMQGLENIQEFTRAQLDRQRQQEGSFDPTRIRIDFGTFWDWTHMLTFPDRALGAEELWFATHPMPVPGLQEPVPVDAEYRLLTYHRIGNRKVGVVDMYATGDFDQEWTEETQDAVIHYKAFGTQSISSRYLFDYDKGTIFGVERPPLLSEKLLAEFAGSFGAAVMPGCITVNPDSPYSQDVPIPVGALGCQPPVSSADLSTFEDLFTMEGIGMTFPGVLVNTQMRYYTNTTYKEEAGARRTLGQQVGPDQDNLLDRRWVSLQFFGQVEAE